MKIARHKETRQEFAVKIIRRVNHSSDDMEAIKREIEILKKIHHRNIIRIFDFFQTESSFLIVLELARGTFLLLSISKGMSNTLDRW